MYITEEGGVDIVSGPEKCHIAELNSGEFFGELALLYVPIAQQPQSRAPTARCSVCSAGPDFTIDHLSSSSLPGNGATVSSRSELIISCFS